MPEEKPKKHNRVSVHLEDEVYCKIQEFSKKYPMLTISGLINDLVKRNLDRYIQAFDAALTSIENSSTNS